MPTRKRVLSIAGWTLVWGMTGMLIMVFGQQGFAKFSATSGWVKAFAHWNYPDWFRMTIGALEILGAALLIWPRTAPVGAALIITIMLGAMATHIVKEPGWHIEHEIVPLTFASVILFARRRQWLPRLFSLRAAVA